MPSDEAVEVVEGGVIYPCATLGSYDVRCTLPDLRGGECAWVGHLTAKSDFKVVLDRHQRNYTHAEEKK